MSCSMFGFFVWCILVATGSDRLACICLAILFLQVMVCSMLFALNLMLMLLLFVWITCPNIDCYIQFYSCLGVSCIMPSIAKVRHTELLQDLDIRSIVRCIKNDY